MDLKELTTQELLDIGISGQNDADLDTETGTFFDKTWTYKKEFVNTAKTEFAKVYQKSNTDLYVAAVKKTIADGVEFTRYKFYKISSDVFYKLENGSNYILPDGSKYILGE